MPKRKVYEWGFTRAVNLNELTSNGFHTIKNFCTFHWGADVYLQKLLQCLGPDENLDRGYNFELEERKCQFVKEMLKCHEDNVKHSSLAKKGMQNKGTKKAQRHFRYVKSHLQVIEKSF